ncbi:MAG: isoprenylcysteine carboxylmethyltransferase family protein [Candidatus Marinimicrobia bacterium]|nr:isoprenylcysteine carboxylmethyltransferase family protein [Candidatus Neomarinimicrobiota bacterium]MCH7764098.1 isoprenylcysteine carboxylmethyltransferase family protein [Candidatus Neomarinimicrobiota bacterium]
MDIRNFFFKYRSYTPIPLALMIIYFSMPMLPYLWYGLACLAIGESIRFWAVSYAGGITRTTNVGAPALCSSGPFAFVRNPLYIGNLFIFSGIVLVASAPNIWAMLVFTWIFFIVQYAMIIDLEEKTLTGLFGDDYKIYKQNIPRLFPRLFSWKNNDERRPMDLLKTLKTEKCTLQNIVLIIVFIVIRRQFI